MRGGVDGGNENCGCGGSGLFQHKWCGQRNRSIQTRLSYTVQCEGSTRLESTVEEEDYKSVCQSPVTEPREQSVIENSVVLTFHDVSTVALV